MNTPGTTYPGLAQITRQFAPGWFASVMGTGALALSTLSASGMLPWLTPLAFFLHFLNIILFGLLAVPWLGRWILHPSDALATMKHPVQASFYPTFSIAMLVIAAQWLAFGQHEVLAWLFWIPGTLLTFAFSFAVLYQVFIGENVAIEHVTPAKYIPAVGLVVIPVAGGPLTAQLQDFARDLAILINIGALGSGLFMYIGLLGLTLQRNYLAKPAFGMLTPTVWIQLAPLSIIPVSLLNLTEALALNGSFSLTVGLLLWGFAAWWLVMASLITITAWRLGMLPFALSWWGFTFPLGAFVLASLRLSRMIGNTSMAIFGLAALGLLFTLWGLTFIKTLRGVVSGTIFHPHP